MRIPEEKRLAAIAALSRSRRQSKDKRPTMAALARKLGISPRVLSYIAKNSLRRQKRHIAEHKRIKYITSIHRNSATIKSPVFAPRTVRRIRRKVRVSRGTMIQVKRARNLGLLEPFHIDYSIFYDD